MSDTATVRKPTKRDRFNELLAIDAVKVNDELVEFIEHELELLDKKNSGEKKPTAKQVANAVLGEAIVDWMEPNTLYLSAEVTKTCPAVIDSGATQGTVTAILTQLYKAGKIVRTEDKRKNYYSLAE